MVNFDNLIPQSPLEGPPLPSSARVKWTDNPEKVLKAIANYATSLERPIKQELYQRGLQHFGPQSLTPQRIAEMGTNWFESRQRAVSRYAYWLTSKLP